MKRPLPMLLVILVPVLATLLAVLFYTEAGARWALYQADKHLAAEIRYDGLSGRLAGPLTVRGLSWRDGSNEIRTERMTLDWQPLRLLSGTLRVELLEAHGLVVVAPGAADGVDPGESRRGRIRLPLTVDIEHLALDDALITAAGREPVTVRALSLGLRIDGDEAVVRGLSLDLASPRLQVEGDAQLPLDGRGDLRVQARVTGEIEGRPIEAALEAGGTAEDMEATALLSQPVPLRLVANADLGADPPRWQASAEGEPFDLDRLLPGSRRLRIAAAHLEGEGSGRAASGRLHLSLHDDEFGEWALTLHGDWDGERWSVPRVALADEHGAARIEGRAGQDAGTQDGIFIDARWSDLAWPPRGEALLTSPTGSAEARGKPAQWRYSVAAEVQAAKLPPASVRAEGVADSAETRLEAIRATWLDGAWQGAGRLAWSPTPSWDFRLAVDEARPARLYPVLEDSRISAEATVSGAFKETLTLDAAVTDLRGELLGLPVEGALSGSVAGGVTRLEALSLRAGETALSGQAVLGAEWDIGWTLRAPDLAALAGGLAGSLHASGSAHGPPDTLQARLELTGEGIAWADHGADVVGISADVTLGSEGRWRVGLDSRGTRAAGIALGRVAVETAGAPARHQIMLDIEEDQGHRFVQRGSGALEGGRWTGILRDGRLKHPVAGDWEQRSPVQLEIVAGELALGDWCWDSGAANLCVQGSRRDDSAAGVVAWRSLDLARLAPLLPADEVELSGLTDGRIEADYQDAGLRARINVEASDGVLRYALPQQAGLYSLSYRRATLTAGADARGLRGEFGMTLSDTEHISANIELPGFDATTPALDPDQPLAGTLELNIGDLNALATFIPEVHAGEGRADARLTLSGTAGSPRLDGNLDLAVKTVNVLRLGTEVEDLRLQARMQRNRLEIDGGARMGGAIEISGSGALQDPSHWEGRLRLRGDNLEVLRLPSAQIDASPDITLEVNPREFVFDGSLTIPRARLEPVRRESAVVVSDDVVVIGGGPAANEARPFRTHGRLELIFGDDVTVEGSGFEGRLAGRLLILMGGPGDVTAQGEVRFVDGRYRAYGQNLVIKQGRALYAGGSVDNPAIDVIASRTRGDRNEIEVGVRVVGTAQSPVVELYSVPAMDEADVLSYLIIGRPLSEARAGEGADLYQAATSVAIAGGEALAERIGERFNLVEISIETGEAAEDTALVLGRSLSPRLYVRYVQGLMEDTNAIQFRYELSDKWTIETESGTRRGAGADILYSLEH